jgi:nucleoside-diphosphate-sugar epimerase
VSLGKCVIFGGSGFIGSHFAEYLINNNLFAEVYIADIRPMRTRFSIENNRIHYVELDVRRPINKLLLPNDITLAVNLAAVHREPGHEDWEYFETNLHGAENVCAWAEAIECRKIIFTSSAACYARSREIKDELSMPAPASAYGHSKLAAEKIHLCWQEGDAINRQLVIVRPGVVFGPGEGGNVLRLVKAVLRRYFFYMGNRDTLKAGVYIKELCNAMWWVLQRQDTTGEKVTLFNLSMNSETSIQDYVDTICKVAEIKRWVPSVPYRLLIGVAYLIDIFAKPLGIHHPFSPVRVGKLIHSNNVLPAYLIKNGYVFGYTLEQAFADWKKESPYDWK